MNDLFDAYAIYAKNNKVGVEFLFGSQSKISVQLTGKNVWELFKNECGKHVVQRESKKRRHTSIVSVSIMPLPDNTDYIIPLSEIEITATKGTGPGGQHKNKTSSAIRMVHKPTGISIFIDGRYQHQNKKTALRFLTARVNSLYKTDKNNKYNKERKEQVGGGTRSNKIRTYNFLKKRVTDHRTNQKCNIKQVMKKGRFDLLM